MELWAENKHHHDFMSLLMAKISPQALSRCSTFCGVHLRHKKVENSTELFCSVKSNRYYTRSIMAKRVASGRAHIHGIAPRQHSSEETSRRHGFRFDEHGNRTSDLPISTCLTTELTGRFILCNEMARNRV